MKNAALKKWLAMSLVAKAGREYMQAAESNDPFLRDWFVASGNWYLRRARAMFEGNQ